MILLIINKSKKILPWQQRKSTQKIMRELYKSFRRRKFKARYYNNTRYKSMLDVDGERREEYMKNHYYKKN